MSGGPYAGEFDWDDPGLALLSSTLDELKEGVPTSPVTVVAPSLAAGAVLRRRLSDLRGSLVMVDFSTPINFARRVARELLSESSWRPATQLELESLIRVELAVVLKGWSADADGPPPRVDVNLVSALARAIYELGAAPDDRWISAKPTDARSRLALRVAAGVRTRAAAIGLGLEMDVFAAAQRGFASADSLGRLVEMGPIVLFSMVNLAPPAERFFSHLASIVELRRLDLLVGETEVDAGLRLSHESVKIPISDSWPMMEVVDCPDRASEIEVAVSEVLLAAEGGVPLERIAVLASDEGAYLEPLVRALWGALVPVNASLRASRGRSRPTLVLSKALSLARSGSRRDLVEFTSLVEFRRSRLGLPSERVEALTQIADLTGNLFNWAKVAQEASSGDAEFFSSRSLANMRAEERSDLIELADFLVKFKESTAKLEAALASGDWDAVAFGAWGVFSQLDRDLPLIFGERAGTGEAVAVADGLRKLRALQGLGESPSEIALFMALESLVDLDDDRKRPDPAGVRVASIESYLPVRGDVVIMVGLDSLSYPRPTAKGLLSEGARRLAGLLSAAERSMISEWVFFADLRHAGKAVLCRPRSTTGSAEALFPSPAIQMAVAKSKVPATWRSVTSRSSFLEQSGGVLGSIGDLNRARVIGGAAELFALSDAMEIGGLVLSPPAPARERFGSASRLEIPRTEAMRLSPTSLERWLGCPYEYFATKILGVEELGDPEDEYGLGHMERGTLLHRIFEAILGEEGLPGEDGSIDLAAMAGEIADRESEPYRRELGTSSASRRFWIGRELARIRREAAGFVEMNSAYLLDTAANTVAVERKLAALLEGTGLGGEPLAVRMEGKVDRIDASGEGRTIIDYKTGSADSYFKEGKLDPHKVQLALYAHMLTTSDPADAPGPLGTVGAAYWFVSERAAYKRSEVDRSQFEELYDSAWAAIASIDAGLFPAGMHKLDDHAQCFFCDPLTGKESWRYRAASDALDIDLDFSSGGKVPTEREVWVWIASQIQGGGVATS